MSEDGHGPWGRGARQGACCQRRMEAKMLWGRLASCTAEDSPSTETHLVQRVKRMRAQKPAPYVSQVSAMWLCRPARHHVYMVSSFEAGI